MLARYVQKGDSIDYRPDTAVAAGDVIVIADLIGIARLDIEAHTLGSLAVVGVFDITKAEGQIPVGESVYWDAEAQKATLVSGSNHYLGKAILAADAEAETVRVLLNANCDFVSSYGNVDAIADLVDQSGGTASDTILSTDVGTRDAVASLTAKLNAVLAALVSGAGGAC